MPFFIHLKMRMSLIMVRKKRKGKSSRLLLQETVLTIMAPIVLGAMIVFYLNSYITCCVIGISSNLSPVVTTVKRRLSLPSSAI